MVSPQRFKFDGIFSSELNIPDLITCVAFDSDDGDVETRLARESVSSESYDGRYKHTHQYKYTETFGCTFTLMKSDFEDFTQEEVRAILKWLTQKDTTALLEVYYDDSNVVSWASIGGFVNLSLRKLANHRTVAIIAEWDSIHPFCLSDIYTITKIICSPKDNKIIINIDTDDNKPVCPRITINHGYNNIPHTVVDITGAQPFNTIADMTNYVEDTVYQNGTKRYYKTYNPTFTSAKDAPDYAGWTTVDVDNVDSIVYGHNTFYYYENKYYWQDIDGKIISDASRPTYGDWVIKDVTRAYTSSDTFEDKTIYHYPNATDGKGYYWMAPHNLVVSNNDMTLSTTSVKLTNTHYDFFGQTTVIPSTIIKHNNATEVITLDGANKIIKSSNVKRVYGDDFNWQWLELYDGKNEIEILGNCEVMVEWREVRKIGEY